MKRLVFLAALLAAAPAFADCDHFKWSVADDVAAFKATPAPLPAVGGQAAVGKAYLLALKADVKFPVEPQRPPKPGTSGAVVAVANLAAGTYKVTLSKEAWIDVVENGAIVRSSGFSSQTDCPAVRKTVRFQLAAGKASVQISNAKDRETMFAISPLK